MRSSLQVDTLIWHLTSDILLKEKQDRKGAAFRPRPIYLSSLCFLLFLVILFLRIHAPDILFILSAAQDIVHSLEGGSHGMIHVVVAVLTVTAYAVQVLKGCRKRLF